MAPPNFARVANQHQPLFPLSLAHVSPPSLSYSLSFLQPVNVPSAFLFHRRPFARAQHMPHVEESQQPKIVCLKPQLETTNGGALAGCRSPCLSPQFLAISSIVQPLFPVRPPILERAFNGLQNYTPFADPIIAIEKPITIHIMSSMTFCGEPESFREVRPQNVMYSS